MPKIAYAALALTMGVLLVCNTLILVEPVSAATCTTSCSGGRTCTCSGSWCTQIEGQGCATYDSNGNETSSCTCGRARTE